jgi:predicted ribosomally synthesized peptide with SipW-like signal peptide
MKKKFLALTMASAVMLMGAGYAYWTDQLTINNTVTTGELNVKFIDGTTRGGDDQAGRDAYWAAYVNHEGLTAGHNGPATVLSDKTVTTKITNMYPGAYAQFYGTVENDGSIPAVFADATVAFEGANDATVLTAAEQEFKDNLRFAIGYKIVDANNQPVATNPASGDGRFWASGTMDQFQDEINDLFTNVRLEPGQKLLLDFPSAADAQAAMESIGYPYNDEMHCITYTLNTAADSDIENQELEMKITLNWKQHNAQ